VAFVQRGITFTDERMDKASEFRQHAEECRALAQQMQQGEHRAQLLKLAEAWERLAEDRSSMVRRHPELTKRLTKERE
jgi:hypothetical protein